MYKKIDPLFENGELIKYGRGEVIKYQGKVGMLIKGKIKISSTKSKSEVVWPTLTMLTELTLARELVGAKIDFNLTALGPVEIKWNSAKEMVAKIQNSLELSNEVLKLISLKLLEIGNINNQILSQEAQGKVATIIANTDKDTHLTHKLVAQMTGLTRETVTLQMLKLEKMGVIDNKNRQVEILDKKALDKILGNN